MKIGPRKPSIRKSISARTTGRAKRAVKSAINPLYGKKGIGWITNPKRAFKNKIYRKTSFSAFSILALPMLLINVSWNIMVIAFQFIFYLVTTVYYLVVLIIKFIIFKITGASEETED